MSTIVLKDMNGQYHPFDEDELFKHLMNARLRILGFDLCVIAELRDQYLMRGGPPNATVESVREVFRH